MIVKMRLKLQVQMQVQMQVQGLLHPSEKEALEQQPLANSSIDGINKLIHYLQMKCRIINMTNIESVIELDNDIKWMEYLNTTINCLEVIIDVKRP